jgi:hypothetical protein
VEFRNVLGWIAGEFDRGGIDFALIGGLDMDRIREYLRVFDREAELDGLLESGKP